MPIFKVYLDGVDTGNLVSGTDYANAYFEVASHIPLTYDNNLELKEIVSSEEENR